MLTVNIHDAKTRLSELIARAVAGEPFVIAKAGKPMVKVEAIEPAEVKHPQRLGFAEGLWTAPDNFDTMAQDEIERMFYGSDIGAPERVRDDERPDAA
jgi:prevent-host-death family protein